MLVGVMVINHAKLQNVVSNMETLNIVLNVKNIYVNKIRTSMFVRDKCTTKIADRRNIQLKLVRRK